MPILKVDKVNNLAEVILISKTNKLMIATDGIKFTTIDDGVDLYDLQLLPNMEFIYTLPIVATNLSGNTTSLVNNFSNKRFFNLLSELLDTDGISSLLIVFTNYDLVNQTYSIDTTLPVIEIKCKKYVNFQNSNMSITLYEIDPNTNTIAPLTNNHQVYRFFDLNVRVDLDLFISKVQNTGFSIYNLIAPMFTNNELTIIHPVKLKKVSNSLYVCKDFNTYMKYRLLTVSPDDNFVLELFDLQNRDFHVSNLIWYTDSNFSQMMDEPVSLVGNTTYYVKFTPIYPEGYNITPIFESSNSNVTITNIEDDKYSITVADITDVESVTFTLGFDYVEKYRRLVTLPINFTL